MADFELSALLPIITDARVTNMIDVSAWLSNEDNHAEAVRLCRDYVDGRHRNYMTSEMRQILNLPDEQPSGRAGMTTTVDFSVNYMNKVVSTLTDRLFIESVVGVAGSEAETETLNDAIKAILDTNDFDLMQDKLFDAAVGDGQCFVLVEWSDENGIELYIEPAYDGYDGMIALMDQRQSIIFAVKIWRLGSGDDEDETEITSMARVNVYYADRVEKYTVDTTGAVAADEKNGTPAYAWALGQIPIVGFLNRVRAHSTRGLSEIADSIPLQDSINRSLYSMDAVAELNGFGIYHFDGIELPTQVRPGMMLKSGGKDKDGNSTPTPRTIGDTEYYQPTASKLEAETPEAYVMAADWKVQQLSITTDTPIPALMGSDTASGEALKQRESGLLGKVENSQRVFGAAMVRVMNMAVAINNEFGDADIPAPQSINTIWRGAEIRNDKEAADIILAAYDKGVLSRQRAARLLAPILSMDAEDVTVMLGEIMDEQISGLQALALGGMQGLGQ